MSIEKDISQLKEAFREFIKVKIDEESDKLVDSGRYPTKWDAEYEVEKKYKRVFDALDGHDW